MRRVLGATVVALAALAFTACGTSSLSYSDGYNAGQALGAARAGAVPPGMSVFSVCQHQWKVVGSTGDQQGAWVRGCAHGFAAVRRTLTGH